MKIELHIPYEFTLCICPHCDMRFIILAVLNYKDEENSSWMMQTNTGINGMFCPYCGKNSKEKK